MLNNPIGMTSGEKKEWLRHPITVAMISDINDQIQSYKDSWSDGYFLTEAENHKALGAVEGLTQVKNWIQSIQEETELDDEESQGKY